MYRMAFVTTCAATLAALIGTTTAVSSWEYRITGKGMVLGEPLRGFQGLTSGIPGPWSRATEELPQLRDDRLEGAGQEE